MWLTRFLFSFSVILLLGLNVVKAYEAPFVENEPAIDGKGDDKAWDLASWESMDKLIVGTMPQAEDFSGRFKVVWTQERLFLLVEIVDDVLIDTTVDPLSLYWEDDCLEIFIDEDKSGGIHLDNYNAFAYHIALDNQVVDFDSTGKPRLLNDHLSSVWKRDSNKPNKIIWEVALDVYPDTFQDAYEKDQTPANPVTLSEGKELGFMLAYCDSDGFEGREHFMNSHEITPVDGDKNRGYIDASVFGSLVLVNGE